jgi:hypothetical protein
VEALRGGPAGLASEVVTLQMERCFLGVQCGSMLASALPFNKKLRTLNLRGADADADGTTHRDNAGGTQGSFFFS